MSDKPNIVIVLVDCLRQDFTTEEYSDTPFIDRMREEGTNFTNMYSTATTTTPCVASLFTGLYSERNDVISLPQASLNEEVTTLAERMRENGYKTFAYATGPVVEDTGLDRGFDYFECRGRNKELVGEWGEKFMGEIEELEEPFFLYLHLWELHYEIDVPEEFDSPEYGERPYDRMFSALDRNLEELDEKLPEDTILILHGDHGESITWRHSKIHRLTKWSRTLLRHRMGLDTRKIERKINRLFYNVKQPHDHFIEDEHGETVFDYMSNVPFIIKSNDLSDDTVDSQCRQVDAYPTVLDLAGIEIQEDLDGISLIPPEETDERPAYIRACGNSLEGQKNWIEAIRADGYKLLTWPNKNWGPELYNIEESPSELVTEKNQEKVESLKSKFPDEELRETEKLEIEEKLKDLGYK